MTTIAEPLKRTNRGGNAFTNGWATAYVEPLAHLISQNRGRIKTSSPDEDFRLASALMRASWVQARLKAKYSLQDILWESWARYCQPTRTYLCTDATAEPEMLVHNLTDFADQHSVKAPTVLLVAVLDGAPEFSRSLFWSDAGASQNAWKRAEAKDAEFYRYSFHVVSSFGGVAIDHGDVGSSAEADDPAHFAARVGQRSFQDACVACFPGRKSNGMALAAATDAALTLVRMLQEHNEVHELSWQDCLFPRIVIGTRWDFAVSQIPRVRRARIVVQGDVFRALGEAQRQTLAAAGVKCRSGLTEGEACHVTERRRTAEIA
ncbi:MAG TPA: hypothetical protein VMS17_05280 [Gemmataceae bacterium]|nr:hypothetical protein [Gemmataceae bacterium]